MKRSELVKHTRRELYAMARAYDMLGRSKMSKDELIEALARVSAKKVMPSLKPTKRRMSRKRKRRRVSVRTAGTAAHNGKTSSTALVRRPAEPVAPAPAPLPPYIDRGPELPASYNGDKLEAMVRDPNWIYAYWDLNEDSRAKFSHLAIGGAWVLRVHNLTVPNHVDIPILLEGGNWYLPVVADTEYQVEMGVLDAEGDFHAAVTSRRVKTPPVGISDVADEKWMVLEEELARLMELSGAVSERFAGSRFISEKSVRKRQHVLMHSGGVSSLATARRK